MIANPERLRHGDRRLRRCLPPCRRWVCAVSSVTSLIPSRLPILLPGPLPVGLVGFLFLLSAISLVSAADGPPWHGKGRHRLLVKVAPRDLERESDELPTELDIDFAKLLDDSGAIADCATLQVVRYDRESGQPIADGNYGYGANAAERPFRWYDAAIPYEFPEFGNAVSRTDGKITRRPQTRAGYFFNAVGDWRSGRLAWLHRQEGDQPSHYAIYFDLLKKDEPQGQIPPRGWLGDGTPRCDQTSHTTMGADHCRIDLDDWNGDGLVDLIVGEHYGHVFWWPNVGSRQQPEFRYAKFVASDGAPLDAGMAAAPKVVDWNHDGVKDLLVGAHWNRLLYYENVGTNERRSLVYRGFVEVDGVPLQLPLQPMRRGSPDVFKRDYYPVPETVDWDDDGDLDLLLGGYVTGTVFFYENVGPLADGTPILRLRGPLQTESGPLNVGHWCASPCVADFDDDGNWELMSGNMPMHVRIEERELFADTFLQLFSADQNRVLRPIKFPGAGGFPRERLATPRCYDWDDDGDLDLVVSARENIYFFKNVGSKQQPHFQTRAKPLIVPWGLAPIAVDQFRDWNQDGRLDLVQGYSVRLNSGFGNPYRWEQRKNILPAGQHIAHPSGIGDDWFWPYLNDFDGDQDVDVLFGDWHGHVWLHRNESTKEAPHFDVEGFRLQLTTGALLKVGPLNKDPTKDFDALQGARTVFTVGDFDRDGRADLVVGDTYGIIRWFRNSGKRSGPSFASRPTFDAPVEIGNLGIRGLVDSTDWNRDGWPDVIASAANGRVRVFLNRGKDAEARFADGFDPGLPPIVQPRVLMADINGDGDEDLFLPSTQGSCFVERSFLTGGYAEATLVAVEQQE